MWFRIPLIGLLVSVPALVAGCSADSGGGMDDSSALIASARDIYTVSEIHSGNRKWTTFVLPSDARDGFDGVVAVARNATREDGEITDILVFDRTTGALALLGPDMNADPSASAERWSDVLTSVSDVGTQLMILAGEPHDGTMNLASLVNERNRCFLRLAGSALLVLGAVKLVAARGALMVLAKKGGASVGAAYTYIKGTPLPQVIKNLPSVLQRIWATPSGKAFITYKVVENAVQAWLVFTEQGREVMAAVTDEIKEDWHQITTAECTLRDYGKPFIE